MDQQEQKSKNQRQDEEDAIDQFKVVLVGDAGVGKTHLMNTYVRGQPPKNNLPTIGIEFASKTITLQDGGKVKAQIWDTAGQERYRGITTTYENSKYRFIFSHFKGAGGALVVYDVTKDKTFDSLNKWIEDLKEQANEDIVIFLVGNKLDLVEKNPQTRYVLMFPLQNDRKVTLENGQSLAAQYKALFEETSAFKGTNVVTCFDKLIQEMYQVRNKFSGNTTKQGNILLEKEIKPSGCNCKCY